MGSRRGALLLLGILAALAAAPASAGPRARLTVDILGGHDDQVLASQDLGVVAPVSEGFATGTGRLLLRWAGPSAANRLDLMGEVSGTSYGSRVEGDDGNLRFSASWRRTLSERVVLELGGTAWRFRRGDGRGLFDADLVRGEARVGWAPGRRWLVAGGARTGRLLYPGREIPGDSTGTEAQTPVEAFAGVMFRLDPSIFVGAEAAYRGVWANVDRLRYEGPVVTLRGGLDLPLGFAANLFALYAHRDYPDARVTAVTSRGEPFDLGPRLDDSWQAGAGLERPLADRLRVFLEGNYLHQASTDPFYRFNQTRATLGVSVDVVAMNGVPHAKPGRTPPPPLAPQATPAGIRFRVVAPGAHRVALVGGFNGWDPDRNLLQENNSRGMWQIVLPLPAGIWRYAFVVDGVWIAPPDAPRYEDDGFGGRNGVLEVPVSAGPEAVTGGGATRQNR